MSPIARWFWACLIAAALPRMAPAQAQDADEAVPLKVTLSQACVMTLDKGRLLADSTLYGVRLTRQTVIV